MDFFVYIRSSAIIAKIKMRTHISGQKIQCSVAKKRKHWNLDVLRQAPSHLKNQKLIIRSVFRVTVALGLIICFSNIKKVITKHFLNSYKE